MTSRLKIYCLPRTQRKALASIRFVYFMACVTSLLLHAGCGDKKTEPTTLIESTVTSNVQYASEIAASTHYPIQIVDRLDRTITFTQPPQRIVSLSPETTELLYALGLGDRMVGVTEHCNYPPEAKLVPKVGIGTVESISRERIIAVHPDVIFCRWDNHEPLVETFERLQIPIVGMGSESLNGLFEEAALVGKITGQTAQADLLVDQMEQRLAALQKRVPNPSDPSRLSVFYQIWDEPLMTVGPGSFIGEMLTLAGLRNIIEDGPTRYPTVSPEIVIARDPDVILTAASKSASTKIESITMRSGWSQISAIKHHRVYTISGDEISRCGPRLLDALEQIINVVYAERD